MHRPLWIALIACLGSTFSTMNCQQKYGDLKVPEAGPQSGYYALFEATGEKFYARVHSV